MCNFFPLSSTFNLDLIKLLWTSCPTEEAQCHHHTSIFVVSAGSAMLLCVWGNAPIDSVEIQLHNSHSSSAYTCFSSCTHFFCGTDISYLSQPVLDQPTGFQHRLLKGDKKNLYCISSESGSMWETAKRYISLDHIPHKGFILPVMYHLLHNW